MPASYWSPSTSISLRGVDFKVKPIVLRTAGIDLILEMDWMKQHRAVIQCQEKSVVVTSLNGDRICVEVVVQAQPTAIVNQLDGEVNEQDRVVEEFLDVFPDVSVRWHTWQVIGEDIRELLHDTILFIDFSI